MAMLPEPWLRGPIPGVHALIAVLYSFQQAREDIARHTEGFTAKQLWATPHGFGSVDFHIRHIAYRLTHPDIVAVYVTIRRRL